MPQLPELKRMNRRDFLKTVGVLAGMTATGEIAGVGHVLAAGPATQTDKEKFERKILHRFLSNVDVLNPTHISHPAFINKDTEKKLPPEKLIVPEDWYTLKDTGIINLAVSANFIPDEPRIVSVANESGILIIKLIPEREDMENIRVFNRERLRDTGWIYEIHPDGEGGAYCNGQSGVHYINIDGNHRFFPKPTDLEGDPSPIEYDTLGLPFGDYDTETGYFWSVPRFSQPTQMVLRLDTTTGEWKQYPFPYRGLNFALEYGQDGKVWVGSFIFHSRWSGLGYIDPANGSYGEIPAYTGQSVANLTTMPNGKLLVSGDFSLHYDSHKYKPGMLSVFNPQTNEKEWSFEPSDSYPGERILKTVLYPNKEQLDLFCRGGDTGFPGITTIDWEKELIGNIFDRWPNKDFDASPDGNLKIFTPWWGKPLVKVEDF